MQWVLNQQNDAGDPCKSPQDFDWAEQPVGVAKILESLNIATTLVNAPLSFDRLQAEIYRKNPLVRRIVWTGGGAHVTVVRGFSIDAAGKKLVHVMDPSAGPIISTYDDVVQNQFGTWDLTLTTNGLIASQPWVGIDLPGSDIRHFEVSSDLSGGQVSCGGPCWETDGCVAWTFVRPNTTQGPSGQCWLKNAMPKQVPNSCCISGTIGEQATDRPGGDYARFDSINGGRVTPQGCSAACVSDKKCLAWTYVKPNTMQGPNAVCWLKDSVPSPVRNDACISAIVWRPPIVK